MLYTREDLSSILQSSWQNINKYLARGEFAHIKIAKKRGYYYFYQNVHNEDLKRLHTLIHQRLKHHYL